MKTLTEEQLKKRRALARKYYWANREKRRALARKYYWANREKHLQRMKQSRLKHLEKRRAYDRSRYRDRQEEMRERHRKYRKENPERVKDIKLRSIYGLSLKDFQRLADKQNQCCAICQRKVALCVDHNHNTGQIRGLLCTRCNRLLGMVHDSITELQAVIRYLQTKR